MGTGNVALVGKLATTKRCTRDTFRAEGFMVLGLMRRMSTFNVCIAIVLEMAVAPTILSSCRTSMAMKLSTRLEAAS